MTKINGLVTQDSIVFTDKRGFPHTVLRSHANFEQIKDLFKQATNPLSSETVEDILEKMVKLTDIASTIRSRGQGRVTVRDGTVYYADSPVHDTIADRIVQGLNQGFNMDPYLKFLENLMQNPSQVAVNELYLFMEHGRMGITDDGQIIAYKKVRHDFTDCHSGRFDNSPGQHHSMPRNRVDDNRDRTCSSGFHFCSFDYLSQFGNNSGNRVVLVTVNPRDVVCIPNDYNNTKARCCEYQVVKELEDWSQDTLAQKTVWTNSALNNLDLSDVEQTSGDTSDDVWSYVEDDSDYLLEENMEILTDGDSIELMEYFVDENGSTTKIRLHVIREDEVYVTSETETIQRVFDFVKSRAALTGEKQAVKIVRV